MIEADDLSVSFGGVRAVDRVSITLHEHEILGLIGPNGSGKSTAINAITRRRAGQRLVAHQRQAVALGNPGRVRRAGVLRTYQTPQTFMHMSCIENVLLTTTDRKYTGILSSIVLRPLMLKHEHARWRHAAAALDRVGLLDRAEESAAKLSYGQQRLLEVARAIAGEPKVIMLDEPSAGLNAAETEVLAGHLRRTAPRTASRCSSSTTRSTSSPRWSIGSSCSSSATWSPKATPARSGRTSACRTPTSVSPDDEVVA